MSKLKIVDKRSETSIMSERNLLSTLNHPFIVNMYFAFQDFYNLYLVMDLLTGGDLRYHIAQKRFFSESETKFFISNMILALEYIHSRNIIHRDIKPENLVLESNGYLRITDFGVAKINEEDNSSETSGTPGYMAPEVILIQNHSFCSDFFALGVIGYEFMLGYRPYLGRSRKEIKQLIISKQAKLNEEDIPDTWNINAMDFINKLLIRKPEKRLGYNGIEELKSHPWMKEIDWEKLALKKIEPSFIPNKNENYDKNYCEEEEDIGEETIERYQIYAQSDLYPDVFKNYTFCNLSYISNYHIKRLKKFKENYVKIKDIVEQNVNNLLKEQKGLNTISKNNNAEVNINHDNSHNRIKSKSLEDLKQYNINDINKSNELLSNNKEIQDNTIKNDNIKKNENESINKRNQNIINKNINNQINDNNTNNDYCTIEANKTNIKNRKKNVNQKRKLSKNKNTREYIKNFKENIVYNNYINLHFNDFSNMKNNNNNINYESNFSSKKGSKSKVNSNITNKTKSKINLIKNLNPKNKKSTIAKSGSMKILENNQNMFSHILSLNKFTIDNKKPKSKKSIHNNNNETYKYNRDYKSEYIKSKKFDYKNIKNLKNIYNKKCELLVNVINNNKGQSININANDTKNKNTENKKYGSGSKIGKCHSSSGFYNEKTLISQRRKTYDSKLPKKNRNLSMNNISNNINYNYNNNYINKNYNTINAHCDYSKTKPRSKRPLRLINFNGNKNIHSNVKRKYNAFSFSSSYSASKSISKSKSKSKNKSKMEKRTTNSKFFFLKDNNKKNFSELGSIDFINNVKLIKYMDEHFSKIKK
jgi:serine/threonine protein kinase